MTRKSFWNYLFWTAPAILTMLSGCAAIETAPPVNVTLMSDVRVAFDSFVSAGYGRGRSMPGFQTTRNVIEATLTSWYESVTIGQAVVDGTPEGLCRFLNNLPDASQCDISVVYIGSIQGPAANLEFVGGRTANWRQTLAAVPIAAHPNRIVILDACHAAAVRSIAAWSERLAVVTLLASGPTEKTYQFEPVRLSPINVRKHYPLAQNWADKHLGPKWDRHISFLGLMWAETTAHTTTPPADTVQWQRFLQSCGRTAQEFCQTKSPRWGSTVQVMPAL